MGAFLEQYVEKLMHAEPPSLSLLDKVRGRLCAGLGREAPTLSDVAAQLRMSARTLRRHIQAEGTTFQQLADETRFAQAKRQLAQGDRALASIAADLGFSEPSAFHRAFRRWAGVTPQAFRRQLTPEVARSARRSSDR